MNINEEIIKELKNKGAKGTLNSGSKFADMGIDSLDLMDMIIVLEEKLNILVPDSKLSEINTIKDLVLIVEELQKG
ncbi:acyl carrier protein [Mesoplasma photuris]|uniref:acyl carrier protein n=1 Tax=Mesoplasma photuris TaxID=217731 RepID=UPI0004E0FC37|nr:phosphopantetheine-binding protein [Mesoplasma photuris]